MTLKHHNIINFELDFNKIKLMPETKPHLASKESKYSLGGSLFIGSELYGLVELNTNISINEKCLSNTTKRLYMINMRTKESHGYIDYPIESYISITNRLVICSSTSMLMGVIYRGSDRTTTYTVYAITNQPGFTKIKDITLPCGKSYYSTGNKFIYLDAENNLAGFEYNLNTGNVIDFNPEKPIVSQKPDFTGLFINNDICDDSHLVIEYYDPGKNYDTNEDPCVVFDISELPPKYVGEYTKSELVSEFDGNYINSYISPDHKPITILNTFPELISGIPYDNICEYVIDFQEVKKFSVGNACNILRTYEIVITADYKPDCLPICGYNIIHPSVVKIINTHLGELVIDGSGIFKMVEDEYRKTLTRFRIPLDNYTSAELDIFIHPFGRIIYSQSGKDGILELNNNHTRFQNIIQGFYSFVLLPDRSASANSGQQQPKWRIKIIGYYPERINEKKDCSETGDEYMYEAKYYAEYQTSTVRLTAFYSTFVRKVSSRMDKALLGHLPDFILDNISRFYVLDKYRADIRKINNRNDLVPILGLS